MTTHFKRIREEAVMCTIQGCPEAANYFFIAGTDLNAGSGTVRAAYCEKHAQEAAKRMGRPWPMAERKSLERTGRKTTSLTA